MTALDISELLFFEDSLLQLDTGLTQNAFAKARFSERMEECGWLATKTDNKWIFSPWKFSGSAVKTESQTVLVQGAAFAGYTLEACLRGIGTSMAQTALAHFAAALVCTVLEEAIAQDYAVIGSGAGGIFISKDFRQIIFVPPGIFEASLLCRSDALYSMYQGRYINKGLSGEASIHFTQSVIAYMALTASHPFESLDTATRTEDYRDHNLVPLKNRIWALDRQLSFFIDHSLQKNPVESKQHKKNLMRNHNESSQPKSQLRVGLHFPLSTLYRELGLTAEGFIPADGILQPIIRKASVPQEQFEATAKKDTERFARSLKIRRWFRHNRSILVAAAGVVVSLSLFFFIYWNGTVSHPTSKGFTSFETVEMFYSGMHNLNVLAIQGSAKGQNMNSITDRVSNFYVSSRTRTALNPKLKTVTPGAWLLWNDNGQYWIYGLTQFTIDGINANLHVDGPAKKTKPPRRTEENGVTLENGSRTEHQVRYNLVFTEGNETLYIHEHTDTVLLTYAKDRWVVTDIQEQEYPTSFAYSLFCQDYTEAAQNTQDIFKTAEALRNKYRWVSTDREIQTDIEQMQKESLF